MREGIGDLGLGIGWRPELALAIERHSGPTGPPAVGPQAGRYERVSRPFGLRLELVWKRLRVLVRRWLWRGCGG